MNVKMDKTMEEAVDYMIHYINTYKDQRDWQNYHPQTFLHDMLYGTAVAMSDDFKFGQGYDEFLRMLLKLIQEKLEYRDLLRKALK